MVVKFEICYTKGRVITGVVGESSTGLTAVINKSCESFSASAVALSKVWSFSRWFVALTWKTMLYDWFRCVGS